MRGTRQFRLLQRWVRLLGWEGLRMAEHRIPAPPGQGVGTNRIRWYYSGSGDDVLFQINETPIWHAAVYAPRFRIYTGWHEFNLPETPAAMKREAERLKEVLHASWFSSPRQRRQFRQTHPECSGYTWKRIRLEGPGQRHRRTGT